MNKAQLTTGGYVHPVFILASPQVSLDSAISMLPAVQSQIIHTPSAPLCGSRYPLDTSTPEITCSAPKMQSDTAKPQNYDVQKVWPVSNSKYEPPAIQRQKPLSDPLRSHLPESSTQMGADSAQIIFIAASNTKKTQAFTRVPQIHRQLSYPTVFSSSFSISWKFALWI